MKINLNENVSCPLSSPACCFVLTTSCCSAPQMPPKRDEAALQEEEELQLAIALSQSEAEEKERMVRRLQANAAVSRNEGARDDCVCVCLFTETEEPLLCLPQSRSHPCDFLRPSCQHSLLLTCGKRPSFK